MIGDIHSWCGVEGPEDKNCFYPDELYDLYALDSDMTSLENHILEVKYMTWDRAMAVAIAQEGSFSLNPKESRKVFFHGGKIKVHSLGEGAKFQIVRTNERGVLASILDITEPGEYEYYPAEYTVQIESSQTQKTTVMPLGIMFTKGTGNSGKLEFLETYE